MQCSLYAPLKYSIALKTAPLGAPAAQLVNTCFVPTAAAQGSSPSCGPLLRVVPLSLLSRLSLISKLSRYHKAIKHLKKRDSLSLAQALHLQLTLHN